jgi:putative glutamine amidotransferase
MNKLLNFDKPVIGIAIDYSEDKTYSQYPWYAIRENYSSAISNTGGIAILLPHEPSALEHYTQLVDGLLFIGGDFDIDPIVYGENINSDKIKTNKKRFNFEYELCKIALAKKLPILGICAGEQLLNVIYGGTLIQHIPDHIETSIEHTQSIPKHIASHKIKIIKDSLLYKILKVEEIEVNSTHHQAVKEVGKQIKVNAVAPDGIIEGIEITDYPFALGVQWHPEYIASKYDQLIFDYFINFCSKTKQLK